MVYSWYMRIPYYRSILKARSLDPRKERLRVFLEMGLQDKAWLTVLGSEALSENNEPATSSQAPHGFCIRFESKSLSK